MVTPRRLRKQPTRVPKLIVRWTGPFPLSREEASNIKREIRRAGDVVIFANKYLHVENVGGGK